MWLKIKGIFTPPVFDDEDRTRVAYLLSVTILALFLVAIVRMALTVRILPEYQPVLLRMNGGLIGVLFLIFIIMRTGRVRLACILFTVYQWVTIAWLTYHYGGLHLSVFSFFVFVILSSGLLLGSNWAISYTAISTLYGFLLLYFEKKGRIEPFAEGPEAVLYIIIPSFITTAVLVYLYNRDINRSFIRVRSDAAQLAETNTRLTKEISARERLENQLVQAQKMEAVGTLAGGIAHDFNNILMAIIGFTELALSREKKGTSLYEDLTEVLVAGNRAKDLVGQILTFSRHADQDMKPVQVKPIVHGALKLLRASLPATIEIAHSLESDAAVKGNSIQIQQALMNLCTNAGHAMREKGGRLEVELKEADLDSVQAARFPDIEPGRYVKLTVRDTGTGMSPEILERIFEPFFTTKNKEEGTGLGLSVVHGIVKSHQGAIHVSSKPGDGAVFTVYLPIIDKSLEREIDGEEDIPTGAEHILFIDDEDSIVNVAGRQIKSLGYEVTTSNSSMEALELFRKRSGEFDFVITDMTMPQMRGDELAGKLLSIRPDIPVVLCTGFNPDIPKSKAKEIGIRAVLQKPILKRDLAIKIREILDNEK
ncbi:MAG: response regulator [Acidobacteria bacterium]|nr:response regulator [Acidobacteriota bacterium]